ncbi:MAG: hypothetical protein LAP86_28070 [Acidobacteriia bacterium]|nr:hypothetical protein [Terriglobia bacterium]
MNCARLTFLVLLAFFLVSCGSGSPAKKIDGFWTASLQNPDGSVAYTFMATLTQSTGSTVNVSSFGFSGPAPCFTAPLGQTATFTASGHSGGYEIGSFGMSIATALMTMQENVLTLNGIRNSDGRISGTWTLTGLSGCSGGGAYTMTAPIPL